jgi:hypothetical protein
MIFCNQIIIYDNSAFMNKLIYWLPRILGLGAALFWLIFSILRHGPSFPTVAELSVVIILVAATALAWKWPDWGALTFLLLAALHALIAWQRFATETILAVSIPLVIIGILFWLNKYSR